MAAINHKKYENMTEKQIIDYLAKVEKRVENLYLKIKQEAEIIKYLTSKMGKSPNNKYDFVPFEDLDFLATKKNSKSILSHKS